MGRGVGVGVGVEVGVGLGTLVGVKVGVGVGVDRTPLQPNKANPAHMKKPIRNEPLFPSKYDSSRSGNHSYCEPPVPRLLHSHTISPAMTAAPPKEAKPAHRNM
jgi:hypothetical protein